MAQADVVVIGGAIMGASVAFWLTRMMPGLQVMVVERDPSFARASTALSVASIRGQFSRGVNVAMSRFGIGFIRDFQAHVGEAAGVPSLGLKENGYLFLAHSPQSAALAQELAAMQRAMGASTEVWAPEAIRARFPWLEVGDLSAGSFGARDEGWFDNMGLLAGLRAAARAQGAVFVADEVTGLRMQGGRVAAVLLGKGGEVPCGFAVNAAGTRAAAIARMAGVAVPVEPRKRTVFVIDAPNARHPDAPLLVDKAFYLRPEHDHWITGTVPEADGPCAVDDFEPDLHLFEDVIWERLFARSHGFDAVKVLRHWVGHYDYNALDQNAILGPHPQVPNLHFINGFSGHGLQQAPAAGRGVAEHLLTGKWQTIDLSELSLRRIVEGRPFLETSVV